MAVLIKLIVLFNRKSILQKRFCNVYNYIKLMLFKNKIIF